MSILDAHPWLLAFVVFCAWVGIVWSESRGRRWRCNHRWDLNGHCGPHTCDRFILHLGDHRCSEGAKRSRVQPIRRVVIHTCSCGRTDCGLAPPGAGKHSDEL